MKRYLVLIILALGIGIVFQGIVLAGMMGGRSRGNITIQPTGANLWELLQKEDYSNNWKKWPGTSSFESAHESHGALSTTYITIPVFMAIARKDGILPDKSIIVKENYSPDRQMSSITVMWKVQGYNHAEGDWFWAKYSPNGKIEAEGKVDNCINCHVKSESNDYIMTGPLK